jgi:hypothetical protein
MIVPYPAGCSGRKSTDALRIARDGEPWVHRRRDSVRVSVGDLVVPQRLHPNRRSTHSSSRGALARTRPGRSKATPECSGPSSAWQPRIRSALRTSSPTPMASACQVGRRQRRRSARGSPVCPPSTASRSGWASWPPTHATRSNGQGSPHPSPADTAPTRCAAFSPSFPHRSWPARLGDPAGPCPRGPPTLRGDRPPGR